MKNQVWEDACGCSKSGRAIDAAGAHVDNKYDWMKVAVLALDQAGLYSYEIERMVSAGGYKIEALAQEFGQR